MEEVKVIKISDNPVVPIPGHQGCTSQEIVGPSMGVNSCVVKLGVYEPGGTADEHVHESSEHVFYILTGEMTIVVNGKSYSAQAGEGLYIPAGVPHAALNGAKGYTTYLAVTLPPS